MDNIFQKIPKEIKTEIFENIISNDDFLLERIISDGHVTENDFWYEQERNEWVIVLSGEAELEYADGTTEKMVTGDYVLIPAMKKHRVIHTSKNEKTIWLALHF